MSERLQDVRLYIGGGYVEAASGRTFETVNPATGRTLATVHEAGAEDVDRVVRSALGGSPSGRA